MSYYCEHMLKYSWRIDARGASWSRKRHVDRGGCTRGRVLCCKSYVTCPESMVHIPMHRTLEPAEAAPRARRHTWPRSAAGSHTTACHLETRCGLPAQASAERGASCATRRALRARRARRLCESAQVRDTSCPLMRVGWSRRTCRLCP